MNASYTASGALWGRDNSPEGFQWLDANDAHRNVFSFVRRSPGEPDVVCPANFAAVPHEGYRLPLPVAGSWSEILNTDAAAYTGSGVGNLGRIEAVSGDTGGIMGQPAYADIVVPPLATVWFRHEG
ncbi:alpha amylase C-terminal domain-containing protein [Nocardioides sp. B-3]|nr:alpha amylase C-terminal domain-containing protein [Nocardioides sp. B-3]UUZ61755.1 alpha amylase C-terminal domain-containing protein [Nocardioides sp. B-3]